MQQKGALKKLEPIGGITNQDFPVFYQAKP